MDEEEFSNEIDAVSTGAKVGARKVVGNLTGVFAIIGAFAAIVQILQAFNHDTPVIKAELRSSSSFVPQGARVTLSPEENAIWDISKNDNIKHYCNSRNQQGATNYFRDEANCLKAKSVVGKVDKSVGYGNKDVSRSVIDLQNTGSSSATGIKIRVQTNGHLAIVDQANKSVLDKDVQSGDLTNLPDLNPSEALKIILDSTQSDQSIIDLSTPSMTYSRGAISISRYRLVSPFFGSIADAVDGVPTILLIIMAVPLCFVVAGAVLVLAAVANAIITGKSVTSVFKA